jgi:hypothetical protein
MRIFSLQHDTILFIFNRYDSMGGQPIENNRQKLRFLHDQVCRTELGPDFGPIARRKDTEFSSVVLCMSLNGQVLQRFPFGS